MRRIGDKVVINRPIWERGEDLPQRLLAEPGDEVVVVRVVPHAEMPYAVRHEGNPGAFWVHIDEIDSTKIIQSSCGGVDCAEEENDPAQ